MSKNVKRDPAADIAFWFPVSWYRFEYAFILLCIAL